MPLSIFRKLGLGEADPTIITLQLADRSLTHPRGIIEDVLVKVEKFIFPVDFIVLNMEDGKEVPIVLGKLLIDQNTHKFITLLPKDYCLIPGNGAIKLVD